MWEFVDKVIYINLDHREDRKEAMQFFLQEGCVPSDKVIRFSAIKEIPGSIGCTKSHINCLKLAIENNWKNVLILEDDLEWINFEENYKKLKDIITSQTYDVCLLGGTYLKTTAPYKINMAVSTTAYIVNSHYYTTLLSNFEIGLSKKLSSYPKKRISFIPVDEMDRIKFLKNKHHEFNIDIYWIKLQLKDNWIGMIDPMCKQTDSYSDVLETDKPMSDRTIIYNNFFDAIEYVFNNNIY